MLRQHRPHRFVRGPGSCTARIFPSVLIPRSFSNCASKIRRVQRRLLKLPAPTFEERCPPASPRSQSTMSPPGSRLSRKSGFSFAPMVVTSFLNHEFPRRRLNHRRYGTAPPSPAGVNVRVTVLSFTTIEEIAAPYSHTMSSISQPSG